MQHHITSLQHFFTQSINFYKGTHIGRESLSASWNNLYVAIGGMTLLSFVQYVLGGHGMSALMNSILMLTASIFSWWLIITLGQKILNSSKHEHCVTARELTHAWVVISVVPTVIMSILDALETLGIIPDILGSLLFFVYLAFVIYCLIISINWFAKIFHVSRDRAAYALVVPGILACIAASLVFGGLSSHESMPR